MWQDKLELTAAGVKLFPSRACGCCGWEEGGMDEGEEDTETDWKPNKQINHYNYDKSREGEKAWAGEEAYWR